MKLLRKIKDLLLINISPIFKNSSFFFQGQMDINPKSVWHNPKFVNEFGGFFLKNDNIKREIVNLRGWDLVRRDMLILLLRSINERNIQGDIVEVGVYRGFTAKLFHYYMPERVLYLFDTFEGFDKREKEVDKIEGEYFINTSIQKVLKYINKKNDNIKIFKGLFPQSIPKKLINKKFAFVHLDADLYEPTKSGLEYFYSKVNIGGFIVIHDYNTWQGARRAVDEFFVDKKEVIIPMPDKSGSVLIVKQ